MAARGLVTNLFIGALGVSGTACVDGSVPDDDVVDFDAPRQAFQGTYRLRMAHSGKCVDVSGGTSATGNGANIHQWTCHDGANQQWSVVPLGGDVYQLEAVHSGRCLDVSGGVTAVDNGRNIHQWGCHGKNNQRFRIIDVGNGEHRLQAVHSGKCLDVAGGTGATHNGANVHQWTCHGGANQRVTLEPVGGGSADDGDDDDGGTEQWQQANLTWYTSYPDPGSEECIVYNGCTWAGQFAALDGVQPESWVAANNIAAVHSKDFEQYKLKTLRLRKGSAEIDVKVYDMCADSDCSGCCTANSASTGFLIDLESYTAERFGVWDGTVEWRCLDCP
jgi:hypothetical protein